MMMSSNSISRLNQGEVSWASSVNILIDGRQYESLLQLIISHIEDKTYVDSITIEDVEHIVSSIGHDIIAKSATGRNLKGYILHAYIRSELKKIACYVFATVVPNEISSKDYHRFQTFKSMYAKSILDTKLIRRMLESNLPTLHVDDIDCFVQKHISQNMVHVSFDVSRFDVLTVQSKVKQQMGKMFGFATFVDVIRNQRVRLVSEHVVKERIRIPFWMNTPSRHLDYQKCGPNSVKVGVDYDTSINLGSEQIILMCRRQRIDHDWSDIWIDAIYTLTNSNVSIRSITERFIIHIPFGASLDFRVAQRVIQEDYILSSLLGIVNDHSSYPVHDELPDDYSKYANELVLTINVWKFDPEHPKPVVVSFRNLDGKNQRTLRANITSSIVLAQEDKALVFCIIDDFCRKYIRAYERMGHHNDGLVALRRELPDYILNNYSRESSVIPRVIDKDTALRLAQNGVRVILFPDPSRNEGSLNSESKYLTAPKGYFVGVKFSKHTNNYIPVCYKKDAMLNEKSTTWMYFHGNKDAKKKSKGASFITTLRSMPINRVGALPSKFVLSFLNNVTSAFRLGLGTHLLSSMSKLFRVVINDVSLDRDRIRVSMYNDRGDIHTRDVYISVCRQEFWDIDSLSLGKLLYDKIINDSVSMREYRFLEELFNVKIVIFSIENCVYNDVTLPVHKDLYIWSKATDKKLMILFVNKFHVETTYECVVLDSGEFTHEIDLPLAASVLDHMESFTFHIEPKLNLHGLNVVGQLISSNGKCFALVCQSDTGVLSTKPCFLAPLHVPEVKSQEYYEKTNYNEFNELMNELSDHSKDDYICFQDNKSFYKWAKAKV